ncbi:MAG: hypothetical protein IKO49_03025 [Bacilli bacterium]|nr:hypothetical protein [Bacilli bacterium]
MSMNKSKSALIAILVVGLVTMTVVYATLSTTLTISNSATVAATKWDIHFENLAQEAITGSNTAEVKTPAAIETDTTKISGLSVEFKKPGDFVTYTVNVKNAGDIPAKLTTYTPGTPTCSTNTSFCSNVEYTITYSDGTAIKVGDTIASKASKTLKVTIKLKANITSMPAADVPVTNLGLTLIYTQA